MTAADRFTAKARELCVSMPHKVKVPPCNGCGYCDQIAAALAAAHNEAIEKAAWKIENLAPAKSSVLSEYARDVRALRVPEGT